jgi:phenylacetate-CoA ligase
MIWNRAAETADREELEELQLRRLREVVDRCIERIRLYRTTLPAHTSQQLDDLRDLRALPFTTKEQLRETYPFGMLAVPREELARIHASSGTKGKPTVVGYTRHDLEVWAEVCARALAAGGTQRGDVVHNAYGYGLFTGGLGLH